MEKINGVSPFLSGILTFAPASNRRFTDFRNFSLNLPLYTLSVKNVDAVSKSCWNSLSISDLRRCPSESFVLGRDPELFPLVDPDLDLDLMLLLDDEVLIDEDPDCDRLLDFDRLLEAVLRRFCDEEWVAIFYLLFTIFTFSFLCTNFARFFYNLRQPS